MKSGCMVYLGLLMAAPAYAPGIGTAAYWISPGATGACWLTFSELPGGGVVDPREDMDEPDRDELDECDRDGRGAGIGAGAEKATAPILGVAEGAFVGGACNLKDGVEPPAERPERAAKADLGSTRLRPPGVKGVLSSSSTSPRDR